MSHWLGRQATVDEVRELTRETAEAIYRSIYIRPYDGLPEPLRINVIDMGVNAGIKRATTLLQELVGAEVDGWIGKETLGLVSKLDPSIANTLYVGMRLAYYEGLIMAKPSQTKWRNGWRNRALSFLQTSAIRSVKAPSAEQSVVMAKAA